MGKEDMIIVIAVFILFLMLAYGVSMQMLALNG